MNSILVALILISCSLLFAWMRYKAYGGRSDALVGAVTGLAAGVILVLLLAQVVVK